MKRFQFDDFGEHFQHYRHELRCGRFQWYHPNVLSVDFNFGFRGFERFLRFVDSVVRGNHCRRRNYRDPVSVADCPGRPSESGNISAAVGQRFLKHHVCRSFLRLQFGRFHRRCFQLSDLVFLPDLRAVAAAVGNQKNPRARKTGHQEIRGPRLFFRSFVFGLLVHRFVPSALCVFVRRAAKLGATDHQPGLGRICRRNPHKHPRA